ncbi:OmpH family outer membrane protein [Candidatus Aerophobetes bacterium]|nr:OmpH family outer membrane protein [Candidatus Aerophobetes bacterium]
MQRKIKMVALGILAFSLCLGLFSGVASCDILEEVFKRTAYVDLEKVFQQYEKKKDLEKKLQEETSAAREKLEEARGELEKLKKEYEAQQFLLTDEAKKERQQEITDKVKEIENLRQQVSSQIKEKQDQYTHELLQDIVNKIKEIAEKEGLIYVFDKAALVYGAPTQDITEKVIAELNKEYEEKKE